MAAIKDRLAKLESNIAIAPQLGAAAWWGSLLSKPKENEHRINAAYFLALDDIIAKPSSHVWCDIQARFDRFAEDMSDSELAFTVAYCGIENHRFTPPTPEYQEAFAETFGNDEGREWLCLLATVYFATFQGAPLPSRPEIEKFGRGRTLSDCRGELQTHCLIPIFEQIFPDLKNRYGYFYEWLEKDGEVESLLESARAHMATIPKPDMIRP